MFINAFNRYKIFYCSFSNFNQKFVDVKIPDKLASDKVANLAAA